MHRPLFINPSHFGRIPDPPERDQECCGTCKHNCYEKKDTFTCSNEESRYYASYTAYDDCCDAYEPKEGE